MQSLNIYAHSLLRSVTEPLLVDIIALRVKPCHMKLILLTFRGDVKQWIIFWYLYKSTIHALILISPRLTYLHNLLEGQAAKAIKVLTLIDTNYDSSVKLFQQRFWKRQQIIIAHMNKLS